MQFEDSQELKENRVENSFIDFQELNKDIYSEFCNNIKEILDDENVLKDKNKLIDSLWDIFKNEHEKVVKLHFKLNNKQTASFLDDQSLISISNVKDEKAIEISTGNLTKNQQEEESSESSTSSTSNREPTSSDTSSYTYSYDSGKSFEKGIKYINDSDGVMKLLKEQSEDDEKELQQNDSQSLLFKSDTQANLDEDIKTRDLKAKEDIKSESEVLLHDQNEQIVEEEEDRSESSSSSSSSSSKKSQSISNDQKTETDNKLDENQQNNSNSSEDDEESAQQSSSQVFIIDLTDKQSNDNNIIGNEEKDEKDPQQNEINNSQSISNDQSNSFTNQPIENDSKLNENQQTNSINHEKDSQQSSTQIAPLNLAERHVNFDIKFLNKNGAKGLQQNEIKDSQSIANDQNSSCTNQPIEDDSKSNENQLNNSIDDDTKDSQQSSSQIFTLDVTDKQSNDEKEIQQNDIKDSQSNTNDQSNSFVNHPIEDGSKSNENQPNNSIDDDSKESQQSSSQIFALDVTDKQVNDDKRTDLPELETKTEPDCSTNELKEGCELDKIFSFLSKKIQSIHNSFGTEKNGSFEKSLCDIYDFLICSKLIESIESIQNKNSEIKTIENEANFFIDANPIFKDLPSIKNIIKKQNSNSATENFEDDELSKIKFDVKSLETQINLVDQKLIEVKQQAPAATTNSNILVTKPSIQKLDSDNHEQENSQKTMKIIHEPVKATSKSCRNSKRIYDSLLKKADKGDPEAQYSIGAVYSCGKNVPQDNEKGFHYYLMAANQGHREAQYMAATCYSYGKGTEENKDEAFNLYLKSAEQGYAKAQFVIGHFYEYGRGKIKKDVDLAFQWYKKAADQGHKTALKKIEDESE